MQKGFMCVAGIDLQSHRHVRPVIDRQMRVDLLACHGGPFEIGRIVDLGETRFMGRVPEIEDQRFEVPAARPIGDMESAAFWDLMTSVAQRELIAIFGPDLKLIGAASCGVEETYGLRSLGCYWAAAGRLLLEDSTGVPRIRFAFRSELGNLKVSVTDIRLYGADHVTPNGSAVNSVNSRIAESEPILVSLGLSRAYRRTPEEPGIHWLQINNIHLPDDPLWRLETQVDWAPLGDCVR
jgi:hypothetical protein